MSVKTAVLGVGYLGRFHAQKYKENSELMGVFDVDDLRALAVANELGVSSFSSLDEAIEAADAFSIVVNTRFHFEIAEKVLRAGKHCLLEKPITAHSEEAEKLMELHDGKSVFQIGHIERVNPAYQHLKSKEFSYANFQRFTPFNKRGADVDVTLDLMIHDIDLCCDLFSSQPTNIKSFGQKIRSGSFDTMTAELTFSGGRMATLSASRVSSQPSRSFWGMAANQFVEANLAQPTVWIAEGENVAECAEFERPDALKVEIQHFLKSIEEGSPILVSAQDGLRNLEIAEAIVQEAQSLS